MFCFPVLGVEPRASAMLGKHCVPGATSQAWVPRPMSGTLSSFNHTSYTGGTLPSRNLAPSSPSGLEPETPKAQLSLTCDWLQLCSQVPPATDDVCSWAGEHRPQGPAWDTLLLSVPSDPVLSLRDQNVAVSMVAGQKPTFQMLCHLSLICDLPGAPS